MRTVRLTAFAALFIGLAVGCGSSQTPASIKGKVTYKQQPLPGGTITFTGDTGSYSGSIQSDGTYTVKDVPVGAMSIIVDTESFNPNPGSTDEKKMNKKDKLTSKGIEAARQQRMKEEGITVGGGGGGGFGPASPEALAAMYMKIPAKYGDKRTSGLRMDVVRGEQTKDIELTD